MTATPWLRRHPSAPTLGLAHAAQVRSNRQGKPAALLLRTSNPPKLEIDFTLDDTRYSALITITDDPPRVIPAR